MAREAGKGSGRRPSEVSEEVVDENWNRIFGKKNTDVDNQIEKYSQSEKTREFHNTWLSPEASQIKVEEIYDPHLTINS